MKLASLVRDGPSEVTYKGVENSLQLSSCKSNTSPYIIIFPKTSVMPTPKFWMWGLAANFKGKALKPLSKNLALEVLEMQNPWYVHRS